MEQQNSYNKNGEQLQAPPPYSQHHPQNMPYYKNEGFVEPHPQIVQPNEIYSQGIVIQQPHTVVHESYVPDTMILSVVSIFFCLCLGFVSLANSISSRNAKDCGRYLEAKSKATTAKQCAIAAIVIGIICGIAGVIIRVVLLSSGVREQY